MVTVSPEHMGQEMPWPLRLLRKASRVCRFVSLRKRRGARVAGLRRQQHPADRRKTRRKTPGFGNKTVMNNKSLMEEIKQFRGS